MAGCVRASASIYARDSLGTASCCGLEARMLPTRFRLSMRPPHARTCSPSMGREDVRIIQQTPRLLGDCTHMHLLGVESARMRNKVGAKVLSRADRSVYLACPVCTDAYIAWVQARAAAVIAWRTAIPAAQPLVPNANC